MPSMISHKKQFVYIHIYKAAGTSIYDALKKYEEFSALKKMMRLIGKKLVNNETSRKSYNLFRIPFLHPHAEAIVVKRLLPSHQFNGYFKFSFVRNPWDIEVSNYHYARGIPLFKSHRANIIKKMSFGEYLEWREKDPPQPQICRFIDENDNMLMDFIGRFENLQHDFRYICNRIKVQDVFLKQYNKSDHRPYREYYTPLTTALVAKWYNRDILSFDYEF